MRACLSIGGAKPRRLDRGDPAVCAVRLVQVVVDSPVLGHDLGPEQRVEAAGRLRARHAAGRCSSRSMRSATASRDHEDSAGAVEPAPVGDRVGDEVGAVVEADVSRATSVTLIPSSTWWTFAGTKCQAGTGASAARVPEPRLKVSGGYRSHAVKHEPEFHIGASQPQA
jgi:hypothetical protein